LSTYGLAGWNYYWKNVKLFLIGKISKDELIECAKSVLVDDKSEKYFQHFFRLFNIHFFISIPS
jgi:hypothetical protein